MKTMFGSAFRSAPSDGRYALASAAAMSESIKTTRRLYTAGVVIEAGLRADDFQAAGFRDRVRRPASVARRARCC